MITPFNQKELCTTFDMIRQAEVREILAANGIDYIFKLNNPARSYTRGHSHGTIGLNPSVSNQCTVYVKKEDFEKAKHLISKK